MSRLTTLIARGIEWLDDRCAECNMAEHTPEELNAYSDGLRAAGVPEKIVEAVAQAMEEHWIKAGSEENES